MVEAIIKLIAVLIVLAGVILVYDARTITKKIFSFGDQNEGAKGLKIIGWLLGMIGALIVFFVK